MKIKTAPIEKIDVASLSGDDLTLLKDFGKSKEFKLLGGIAVEAKTRRAFEALETVDMNAISILKGVNIGLDFMLDTVNRAKQELENRGDEEFDKEE